MSIYTRFSVFGILLLITCLVFPAVVDNYFLKVQNGEIPLHSCILSEYLVVNSTLSSRLQCELYCKTDPGCVGFDLNEAEARRCRLLVGFPAMIPTHTVSDQSARYQKVNVHVISCSQQKMFLKFVTINILHCHIFFFFHICGLNYNLFLFSLPEIALVKYLFSVPVFCSNIVNRNRFLIHIFPNIFC